MDYEILFWAVLDLCGLAFIWWGIRHFSVKLDIGKGKDPYRYCPKEEDEW